MTITTLATGYLDGPYLSEPYATGNAQGSSGWQVEFIASTSKPLGMQALFSIVDFSTARGMQALLSIQNNAPQGFEIRVDGYPSQKCAGYLDEPYMAGPYLVNTWCMTPGWQANFSIVDKEVPKGFQATLEIAGTEKPVGFQSLFRIVDYTTARGFQALAVIVKAVGFQALATLYNTTNLRLMFYFPSRGLSNSNWVSNSTEPGDFSVQHLDTDIVEQVWRSATGTTTGIQLKTDTGFPQGVFLDTLAILNHNLTRSASVFLIGADNPAFSPIGTVIQLEPRAENMFYISPELPTQGFRYWRLDIDDPTNPYGFVGIGTLIFGPSGIFHGECFVDEIEYELRDFADTVRTEGFTNIANSRAQKRRLHLEFRSLDSNLQNFLLMRGTFQNARTVFKCLWIPTPSATDQEVTARFAVFAKLATIPVEKHNNKGPRADYVSFSIDLDESL